MTAALQLLIAALLALPDQRLTPADATDQVYWAEKVVESMQGSIENGPVAFTAQLDAPLLLAVAWRETRLDATRVAGRWAYCGVMQTEAHGDRASCLDQQNLNVGYWLGAQELVYWLGRRHGDLARALASHACGNTITRRCRAYAGHVLSMAAALRRAMEVPTT